jgi:hypothetical protein
MHSVQIAIEGYEMENETYPLDNNVPLASFCTNYLMPGNYMAAVPKNPFTGVAYTDADQAGKIIYSYDQASGKYTLIGYKRNGLSKIQELSNL